MERENIDKEEALRIIASQLPIDEKKGYADFVIDNGESLEATETQVKDLWEKLQQIQKAQSKKAPSN